MVQKIQKSLRIKKMGSVVGLVLFLGGCGYQLRKSKSLLLAQEGIETISIAPIRNNTYKPGVENSVYNNLARILAAHGGVQVIQYPRSADAVLEGTVQTATYTGSASTQVSNLNPAGLGSQLPTSLFVISTEYLATLVCHFRLFRSQPRGEHQADSEVWSSTFSRSKPFPAANQLDVPGMTAPLINESEFDRALSDLARSMMEDVSESMLALF